MYSDKRQFGNKGEDIACMFLEKRGFVVLNRNYLRTCGEIDIVAKKGKVIHFVEVKSASLNAAGIVSHVTRPEENIHAKKLERLYKTIELYLIDKKVDEEWQIDIIIVKIDSANKKAEVEIIENIIS